MSDNPRPHANHIVVIGAGIGGLTTAAVLARAGLDVTVLEGHVYAGGCAGTFYHQGYRFEAGATLAGGFYPGGPMDLVARAAGIDHWPAQPSNPALVVHMPDAGVNTAGRAITRWTDDRRHEEHIKAFGAAGEAFWRWQERTADVLWDLALRLPPWPPQTPSQAARLVAVGAGSLGSNWRLLHLGLAADAVRPVSAHLRKAPEALRIFVDGQLLIAAQTTSAHANALYGASALDLPRRGVVHLHGGMGAIANTLVDAVRRAGGRVLFRQKASRVVIEGGRPVAVGTQRGGEFPADRVIANLTPWNLAVLLGEDAPRSLRQLPPRPRDGWGAFTVYVGFDGSIVPSGLPLHHQVIMAEPMAEGNTAFLSLSPTWDGTRAPAGHRALTISTHTRLDPWWSLEDQDPAAFAARRQVYADRLLDAAERVLPSLRAAAGLVLPGTPATFQRFTGRRWGWVGGFPQTSLFRTWAPQLGPGLYMVGDSIFPGQSTAAVALGGLRVANDVAHDLGLSLAPALPRNERLDSEQKAYGRVPG